VRLNELQATTMSEHSKIVLHVTAVNRVAEFDSHTHCI